MSLILSGTDGLSDVDGSAATPAIRGTDANTGIFFPAADTIAFAEGGAEVARFDSAGNFGLGVTPSTTTFSGSKMLQVGFSPNVIQGITSGNFSMIQGAFFNSAGNMQSLGTGLKNTLYSQTDGSHQWFNAPVTTGGSSVTFTQAMTLDSLGNLGIGTTTPSLENGNGLVVYNSSVPRVVFRNSTTGTSSFDGTDLALVNSDFYIFNRESGAILLATSGTERARIDSSGNLLVGTTTGASSTSALMQLKKGGVQWDTGPNGSNGGFNVLKDGTTGVYLTSGATAWSGLSDETTKDIIEPIENASQKISTLRTVIGKYKTDEEGTRRAFLIAQDVKEVLPEAVNENENGKLGLQYTDVMPLLVAAIKEQQALITQLTARITALESA
jgi:hypothetical protein